MTFSMTFSSLSKPQVQLSVSKIQKSLLVLQHFFDLKQFNRHKLWHSPKCAPFMLLNYSSLPYIAFALSTAVNNLSNKTSIFHDFQGPTIKFHDFPGLEIKFLNSMTFQVFHDLYKPCDPIFHAMNFGKKCFDLDKTRFFTNF